MIRRTLRLITVELERHLGCERRQTSRAKPGSWGAEAPVRNVTGLRRSWRLKKEAPDTIEIELSDGSRSLQERKKESGMTGQQVKELKMSSG